MVFISGIQCICRSPSNSQLTQYGINAFTQSGSSSFFHPSTNFLWMPKYFTLFLYRTTRIERAQILSLIS